MTRNNYEEVFLRLWGEKLEDQEWFGKTDPLIKIQNEAEQVIYTTEVGGNKGITMRKKVCIRETFFFVVGQGERSQSSMETISYSPKNLMQR